MSWLRGSGCALVLLLGACLKLEQRRTPSAGDPGACAACLAGGGTWQPEANACTRQCALQDISCFVDRCPGGCSAGACGDCFSRPACTEAGCRWSSRDESQWCR